MPLMISKQQIKFVKSLQYKKYRKKAQAFLVEGEKCVEELMNSDFEILLIAATEDYMQQKKEWLAPFETKIYEVSPEQLRSMGTLMTNGKVLAVAKMRRESVFTIQDEFVIALDSLQDPGNLGTIIRIADWYGISKILLSENSVDFYNPKVIHGSMGSFVRVELYYCDLTRVLTQFDEVVKYGAFMEGKNIHELRMNDPPAIFVIGNEAHGISLPVAERIDHRIHIPRIGGAESLNAAVATAIICDNIFREI